MKSIDRVKVASQRTLHPMSALGADLQRVWGMPPPNTTEDTETMDRDSFPTLTSSDTGWPVMNVDLSASSSVSIEVYEDHERGGDYISITTKGVKAGMLRITIDGAEVAAGV